MKQPLLMRYKYYNHKEPTQCNERWYESPTCTIYINLTRSNEEKSLTKLQLKLTENLPNVDEYTEG